MESSLELQAVKAFALLSAILLICLKIVIFARAKAHKIKEESKSPPEARGAWPIIGHLHLLGAKKLLHRTLDAMADEQGPVFSLRLGMKRALVVSSWEVARECFTTNDKVLSSRPTSLALNLMAYDHAVLGFAPYGPYWRHIRKLVVIELLSNHRLEMLKHVRDSEVKLFVKQVYGKWVSDGGRDPVLVDMKEKFADLSMNIILRIIAGKRIDDNKDDSRRWQKAKDEFVYLVGLVMVSDTIPFLGWVDLLSGYKGRMKRSARETDIVLGRWVEEHRLQRLVGDVDGKEKDFIHVMMSLLEDSYLGSDADTIIKATCLSMILGGNDTTMITLTWTLSLLLNNRDALKRAQDELEKQVGKHRQVDESDIKNLVYLQAIVKETLRLYPVLPLLVPHEAMEDCTIAGFHVPAGTQLWVNLWKLHRDPNIWPDPSEFRPERFLLDRTNVDVRGKNFELIPFGSGRRMCPGITFALQILHLTLARLLHGFELGTVSNLEIDMTESPGLTVPKATPLEVLLTPRLSSALYNC